MSQQICLFYCKVKLQLFLIELLLVKFVFSNISCAWKCLEFHFSQELCFFCSSIFFFFYKYGYTFSFYICISCVYKKKKYIHIPLDYARLRVGPCIWGLLPKGGCRCKGLCLDEVLRYSKIHISCVSQPLWPI